MGSAAGVRDCWKIATLGLEGGENGGRVVEKSSTLTMENAASPVAVGSRGRVEGMVLIKVYYVSITLSRVNIHDELYCLQELGRVDCMFTYLVNPNILQTFEFDEDVHT